MPDSGITPGFATHRDLPLFDTIRPQSEMVCERQQNLLSALWVSRMWCRHNMNESMCDLDLRITANPLPEDLGT